MRVILTEDVPSLGAIGELVAVKNGYARNFLLPRQKAVLANESNTKRLEHHKRVLTARSEKLLSEKKSLAAKIEKVSLEIGKQVGEDERIFGSVTAAEISELLEKQGLEISKKDITISEDVKKIGVYQAKVNLHAQVSATVKFWVVAQK